MDESVRDALLSGFFQVLFDRLAPLQLPQFVLEGQVRSELSKWRTTLSMILAVFTNAEGKQLTDVAVKMWLDDLRHLAYDVEDVLDEFATEASRRNRMIQGSTSKVHSLIPSCLTKFSPGAIMFNISLGSKIKDISSRLERLCKQRVDLGLENVAEGKFIAPWKRPLTTCLPTEPRVFGRDDDVEKILKMLRDEERSYAANFGVIPIVGMAGVGKTTLARMVYNHRSVAEYFDLRAWVCVSADFNVLRVSKAILESITHSSCDLTDINEVQLQLQYKLTKQRFLLILDDVWSKSYDLWEMLKSPLMAGVPTSKVIVTTRRGDVALTVGQPSRCYHLKLLSDGDCLSVFEIHAARSRADQFFARPNICKKIVEKCEGLPLVARTLGGLFRLKERDDEWKDILNCRIWDFPEESNILPELILSYYHLPSHLKRCFTYCAIFPKNYVFEEKKLIFLWMAEGLIQPSKNNKQLEDIGSEYTRDLLSRSIFQKTEGDAFQFTMHNLFVDLAQWISGESTFKVEDGLSVNIQSPRFKRVRHFSSNDPTYKFENFNKVKRLRTFLLILAGDVNINRILNVLPQLKKLRVLSLKEFNITELPNSIFKGLRYLRYLDLGGTKITSLPTSIGLLFNLQTLILRDCDLLNNLPSTLKNLINLRHLDVRGATLISWMPSGMHNLKKLHTLSNFVVDRDIGSCLIDLKDLEFLSGELRISRIENMTNRRNVAEAVLVDKQYLKVLVLEWGSEFDGSRNVNAEKDVLQMLQPHTDLTTLTINRYGGSHFPSWLGNPSFSNMVILRIVGCENCTCLPSLGVLRLLKDLTINEMTNIRSIGKEFYGEDCTAYFQSLETLHFTNLPNWEHWDPNEDYENFQCLRELSIIKCPKLSESLPDYLPSLQKLVIQQCEELVFSTSSLPLLRNLEVDGCKGMVHTPSNRLTKQRVVKAEQLRIKNCPSLTSLMHVLEPSACLDHLVIEGCHSLTCTLVGHLPSTLKRLEIQNCGQFQCLLGDVEGEGTSNLSYFSSEISPSSLEHFSISDCPSFQSLSSRGQLPEALKYLEIRNCPRLFTLASMQLPMNLKHLEVLNCQNLRTLSSGGPLPESLEHLYIDNCPITSLQMTGGHLPESLQHLNIQSCTQLETLASGHFPAELKYLKINCCDKLVSLPEGLQNLRSHCEVDIHECQGLVPILQVDGLPISDETIVSANVSENLTSLSSSMDGINSLQEVQ